MRGNPVFARTGLSRLAHGFGFVERRAARWRRSAENACGSRIAMSDNTLRSRSRPGELDPVHELRIGQPVLAGAGVDPLDPQCAKIALFVAAVAIGVAQRLFNLFDRDAIGGRGRGRGSPWRAVGPFCGGRGSSLPRSTRAIAQPRK